MRTHVWQYAATYTADDQAVPEGGAAWVVEKPPYKYIMYIHLLYCYKSTNTDESRVAQAIERCLGGVLRGLLRNRHRVSLQILTPGSIQAPKP